MPEPPVSTEPPTVDAFDTSRAYHLHPRVALRPEPFGALAYHYDSRRLNFLRSPDLVAVVKQLTDHGSIDATLVACDVDERRRPTFRRALEKLAASKFIEPTTTSEEPAT